MFTSFHNVAPHCLRYFIIHPCVYSVSRQCRRNDWHCWTCNQDYVDMMYNQFKTNNRGTRIDSMYVLRVSQYTSNYHITETTLLWLTIIIFTNKKLTDKCVKKCQKNIFNIRFNIMLHIKQRHSSNFVHFSRKCSIE